MRRRSPAQFTALREPERIDRIEPRGAQRRVEASHHARRAGGVYLKPSRAFLFVILGLIVLRWTVRLSLQRSIPLHRLSGLFFLLARVVIATWRAAMLRACWRLSTPP